MAHGCGLRPLAFIQPPKRMCGVLTEIIDGEFRPEPLKKVDPFLEKSQPGPMPMAIKRSVYPAVLLLVLISLLTPVQAFPATVEVSVIHSRDIYPIGGAFPIVIRVPGL